MIKIDHYTLHARFLPALFIAAPLAGMAYTWMPDHLDGDILKALTKGTIAVGVAAAVAFITAQMTRDMGKKLEGRLWPKWDGAPSVRFLRHRDASLDGVTKARYHKRLVELGAVHVMPTAEDEDRDPGKAEEFYRAASDWLRSKTRDEKKFPLLFKENVNYGFQRNLLACKPLGFAICAASALSVSVAIHLGKATTLEAAICALVALYLLSTVKEGTLQRTSEVYARRLLEAIDQLEADTPTRKTAPRKKTEPERA
jgi:hypothetical protein